MRWRVVPSYLFFVVVMTFATKKLQRVETKPIDKRTPTGLKVAISVPQLLAAGFKAYSMEDTAALKVLRNFPSANQMVITNTSSQLVEIRLSNSDASAYPVPANTIYAIKSVDYQYFDITNKGAATITADQVKIHVIYEAADKVQIVSA